MTEEVIDPGLLEQTKNQIRKLVAEIADLAESDIQPNEFYVEFLNRAVAAVAASGGAFWMLDGRGGLRLQYQVEFAITGMMDGRVKTAPHDALLGAMLQATQAQNIPPNAVIEGMPQAFNPTDLALIIAPLMVDKQVVGLLEILMDPNRRAAQQKSTLRFVSDLCDLAATYLKNRQMRQMMSQQRLWNQLEGFTHQIHGSLDLKETSYSVVNDGKRLVGCDRLSVALKISGRTMVEAISGQEIVEQRSNLIRELTRLCKVVIRSGEDLVYTGNTDGCAPDIRDALEMYVDESGSKVVVITLLHKPDEEKDKATDNKSREKIPFGCLVSEQIGDELAPTDMHARTEVVSRHASTALWNAQEHHKIFMKPVLKAMGSPWRMFRGRTLAKIGAVLGAILVFVMCMAFIPCTLTIEGHGSLLPEDRHKIYAPVAGIVAAVPKDHDERVHKGDIVIKLDSKDLQKELNGLIGERNKADSQIQSLSQQVQKLRSGQDSADLIQVQAQLAEAKITAKSTKARIEIVEEQLESMNIRSPQDGIITTWEAQEPDGPARRDRHRVDSDCRNRRRVDPRGRSSGRRHGPGPGRPERSRGQYPREPKEAGNDIAGLFRDDDRPRASLPGLRHPGRADRRDDGGIRAIQEPAHRQGDRRLQRGRAARLSGATTSKRCVRVRKSGRGSIADGPTWLTTSSASRSRSSTSLSCSAGRS